MLLLTLLLHCDDDDKNKKENNNNKLLLQLLQQLLLLLLFVNADTSAHKEQRMCCVTGKCTRTTAPSVAGNRALSFFPVTESPHTP